MEKITSLDTISKILHIDKDITSSPPISEHLKSLEYPILEYLGELCDGLDKDIINSLKKVVSSMIKLDKKYENSFFLFEDVIKKQINKIEEGVFYNIKLPNNREARKSSILQFFIFGFLYEYWAIKRNLGKNVSNRAVKHYLSCAELSKDALFRGFIFFRISLIYRHLEDFEKERKFLKLSIELLNECRDSKLKSKLIENQLYRLKSIDNERDLDYLLTNELSKKIDHLISNNEDVSSYDINNIKYMFEFESALCFIDLTKEFRRIEEMCKNLLTYFDNKPDIKVFVHGILTYLYLHNNKLKKAYSECKRAIDILENIKTMIEYYDSIELEYVYRSLNKTLAILYTDINCSETQKILESSVAPYGNNFLLKEYYLEMGRYYYLLLNFEKGRKYFEKALDIDSEILPTAESILMFLYQFKFIEGDYFGGVICDRDKELEYFSNKILNLVIQQIKEMDISSLCNFLYNLLILPHSIFLDWIPKLISAYIEYVKTRPIDEDERKESATVFLVSVGYILLKVGIQEIFLLSDRPSADKYLDLSRKVFDELISYEIDKNLDSEYPAYYSFYIAETYQSELESLNNATGAGDIYIYDGYYELLYYTMVYFYKKCLDFYLEMDWDDIYLGDYEENIKKCFDIVIKAFYKMDDDLKKFYKKEYRKFLDYIKEEDYV